MTSEEIEDILREIYTHRVGKPVIHAELLNYGRSSRLASKTFKGGIGYFMEAGLVRVGEGRIKTPLFPTLEELMLHVRDTYCVEQGE